MCSHLTSSVCQVCKWFSGDQGIRPDLNSDPALIVINSDAVTLCSLQMLRLKQRSCISRSTVQCSLTTDDCENLNEVEYGSIFQFKRLKRKIQSCIF